MKGEVIILGVRAYLTRDTDSFATMDPYCKFKFGK
jgi:hypothetical protein